MRQIIVLRLHQRRTPCSHRVFTDGLASAGWILTKLQAVGAQPQALANAVYAYAANIDNLGALTNAVTHIAHKHASLHVRRRT